MAGRPKKPEKKQPRKEAGPPAPPWTLEVLPNNGGGPPTDRELAALRGWEHVASGPWSDSPDHEGYARYEVAHSAAKDVWALGLAVEDSIVAVMRNARGLEEHDIVATLLSAAEASGDWPCLEEYQREGRFFLNREPLTPPAESEEP